MGLVGGGGVRGKITLPVVDENGLSLCFLAAPENHEKSTDNQTPNRLQCGTLGPAHACSGTLTSGWGIPAGWHPENSLFGNQHMGFLSCYEEDDKRVVVPGLGG